MPDIAGPAPLRAVRLGIPDCTVEHRPDGTILMRARAALGPYPDRITERLIHWAERTPDRVFMADRDPAGAWRTITYAQTLERVRAIAAALLRRDLSVERPIMILSGNDIEHALIGLAAAHVGIPHAPISPAYSLISTDFGKLRHIVGLLNPGLVFAADGAAFWRAIEATVPAGVEVVVTRNPIPNRRTTPFAALAETPAASAAKGDEVEAAFRRVGPDTIVKFLFTSGSTGAPKAVINTQRMWCANQVMIRGALAYFQDEPPVIVDWAPWHHTAGGNHDVGLVLYNGGTFYVDDGKPVPGAIEATVRNLREVAPTWYFTVPKGYEALLPYLRADDALRRTFFSRLKVLWFAGAGISQPVFDEIKRLAIATCGERIAFLTGFGSTETAPCALARTFESEDAANMGVPVAGMTLKLVPRAGKLEARVKGPNVTPGYWRAPALTEQAFDQEGFYRLGDTFRFADPADPARGLLFGGRIAEDFKLSTGTWVHVGPLRATIMEGLAGLARDVVIAGPGRPEIGVLIFPDTEACGRLAPDAAADAATLATDPRVVAQLRARLQRLASAATGSSNRVTRAMLLTEPPSLDAGEITDKGSLNQRAVLAARAALVETLYAEPPAPGVIRVQCGPGGGERDGA
ncbi:MAG TPA: feruloyl-CoA synthase [Xanthobacteraceae bacterium]